ncbi:adenylyl-sulfate kinase [bacterium]|nr:adenylyl-sulfate kinase [bacterium]
MPDNERNIVWHAKSVSREKREAFNRHRGCVLWYTGLSGSGKSTVANKVEELLSQRNAQTYLLDGDNIRFGLNSDLGFDEKDRRENIRRIGEVAKLFADSGTIVSVAFISPYRADRQKARSIVEEAGLDFIEIYVKCDLAVCEGRDPKGLYKKARSGEIKNFTGLDAPYEEPLAPELALESGKYDPETLSKQVLEFLNRKHILL